MRPTLILPSLLGLVALGALTGCPDRTISKVSPEQGRVEYKDIPVTVNRNLDILFVIDDSGSMADKQANLKANFPEFIKVLETIQGGLPDVHIGVVSSDMGTKPDSAEGPAPGVGGGGSGSCNGSGKAGALQTNGVAVTGTFIRDIKQTDGSRMTNYTGDLATVFGDMASIGRDGCGFEQHLHAMKAALNNNPANTGFIRADAFLAVIFIADEDDCSMAKGQLLTSDTSQLGPLQSFRCTRYGVTCDVGGQTDAAMNQLGSKDQCHSNEMSTLLPTVKSYADFLKSLKPDDPTKLIVAGVLGLNVDPGDAFPEDSPYPFVVANEAVGGGPMIPTLQPACKYQGRSGEEKGAPATRLMEFLQYFPNRNTAVTICQPDLSGGLSVIAELLKTALGNPCIEGQLADVDPETAGIQYDCSVSYVTNQGKPTQTETILPACNPTDSNVPCWKIDSDPMGCPTAPNNQVLVIVNPNTPPPETHIIANCVTDAI